MRLTLTWATRLGWGQVIGIKGQCAADLGKNAIVIQIWMFYQFCFYKSSFKKNLPGPNSIALEGWCYLNNILFTDSKILSNVNICFQSFFRKTLMKALYYFEFLILTPATIKWNLSLALNNYSYIIAPWWWIFQT